MRYIHAFDARRLERTSLKDDALAGAADGIASSLSHVGPINPRDEAIFWLTAAAEIEHALMVQCLFAAYSLDPDGAGDQSTNVNRLQQVLLQISREEMGHLITVQNLLVVLGGALNFNRDHSPHTSDFHPFRFKLEPTSLGSLAKYVVAESPDLAPDDIEMLSEERRTLLRDAIYPQAQQNNDGRPIRHVGPIFARLIDLVRNSLGPEDIHVSRTAFQADWSDWGYFAAKPDGLSDARGGRVLVRRIDAEDPEEARAQIVAALEAIGNQGEFVDRIDDLDESHFERFLQAYEMLQAIESATQQSPVWPVVSFPNTTVAPDPTGRARTDALLSRHFDDGRITNPRSRDWARLFNLRYRILLQTLLNGFAIDEPLYETSASRLGNRTAKGLLHGWAFAEMVRIKKLSRKLVTMPLDEDDTGKNAGPPFELPYSLQLPPFEPDRWRSLADLFAAGEAWAEQMLARHPEDADDPFLAHLADADAQNRIVAAALANTGSMPDEAPREDRFKRVVLALEEAVRGFDITAFPGGNFHRNFWAGRTRNQFVAGDGLPGPVITPGASASSELVNRITRETGTPGAMPRSRPNMPDSRVQLIRNWIDDNAPDANPAGEIGLNREPAPKTEPRPPEAPMPPAGSPSFEQDIRPLFTPFDRDEMIDWFDLHDYDDVKTYSDRILERLEIGDMPCTGAWPPGDVAKFKAWMNAEFPP